MSPIAPDTQQNLVYAIYFTISHNFEAIIYFGFMCLAALLALISPRRSLILVMLGFMILLFGFQYNKHILEPLRQQTTQALITERQSYRAQRAIDLTLAKVLPFAFPTLGWTMIALGAGVGVVFERNRGEEREKLDKKDKKGGR